VEEKVAFVSNTKEKKQEAQLSQRNRATLRVIECFASHSSSLKVIRNDTVE